MSHSRTHSSHSFFMQKTHRERSQKRASQSFSWWKILFLNHLSLSTHRVHFFKLLALNELVQFLRCCWSCRFVEFQKKLIFSIQFHCHRVTENSCRNDKWKVIILILLSGLNLNLIRCSNRTTWSFWFIWSRQKWCDLDFWIETSFDRSQFQTKRIVAGKSDETNGYRSQWIRSIVSLFDFLLHMDWIFSVEFDEFIAVMGQIYNRPISDDEMRRAFQCFDIDQSGYITVHELHQVLQRLNQNISEQSVREVIRDIDTDRDGKISYAEFVRMLQTIWNQCKKKKSTAIYK